METRVILPDSESPQTIKKVVTALRSATVESTDDEWEINLEILKVFNNLAWMGEDEDGPYPL